VYASVIVVFYMFMVYNQEMGAPEKKITQKRISEIDPITERLFRINAGTGWVGTPVRVPRGKVVTVKGGPSTMVIHNARPLQAAPKGWPDLFGWTSVVITEDMVGSTVAVATGEEVKANGGRLSPEQNMFGSILSKMGGIFRVLRG
jgi:hypothetical protein